MSSNIDHTKDGASGEKRSHLNFQVRYVASKDTFHEAHAKPDETLAHVKPRVLEFFHLKEGPANGGTKSYIFVQEHTEITDLTVTLGKLAGHDHDLKLKLIERFEQG